MSKRGSKGFTLIELIAVLVILAILALIVTPLVLNVVKKAKDSANKRSVDAYGKAVELSIATYLLDTGDFPTSIDELTIEYSGSEVVCKIQKLNEDSSVYLSECTVGGTKVKDSSTDDGWYHYGKSSATVYQSYSIGDIVTYNGMNFYVIADSDETSEIVTTLKAEPLKTSEIIPLLDSTEIKNKIYSTGEYLTMAYYFRDNCVTAGDQECSTDYSLSDVKQVVDVWAAANLNESDLKKDFTGYNVRLITHDEYFSTADDYKPIITEYGFYVSRYDWMYNIEYNYWTMSPYEDSSSFVWVVHNNGKIDSWYVHYYDSETVRPVVTFAKSSL